MKTIKHIAILSLLMIFIGAYASNRPEMIKKANIRYDVHVILNGNVDICNVYNVQLIDETGRQVSPQKIFDPAKQEYIFTEDGPATGMLRIARIVMANNTEPYICPVFLSGKPDVKIGPFFKGEIYTFVLRPVVNAPVDKD